MKVLFNPLCVTIVLTMLGSVSFAGPVFTGGDIGVAGNWTGGLPTNSADPGTIANNGTVDGSITYDGLFIDQTGGDITQNNQGGGNYSFENGDYNMTGGTWSTRRGLTVGTGQTFTVDGGTFGVAIPGGGGDGPLFIRNAGLFVLESGSVTVSTDTVFINGSSLRINGGTFTVAGTGSIGNAGFHASALEVSFNGGTISASQLKFDTASAVAIGGSTPGTATFDSFSGVTSFDWSSGSLMSLTMSTVDEWAETEWNAGRMTLDGDNNAVLGNWAAVQGTIFNYDSSTETLSLVPEPASVTTGLMGLGVLMMVRRRSTRC